MARNIRPSSTPAACDVEDTGDAVQRETACDAAQGKRERREEKRGFQAPSTYSTSASGVFELDQQLYHEAPLPAMNNIPARGLLSPDARTATGLRLD